MPSEDDGTSKPAASTLTGPSAMSKGQPVVPEDTAPEYVPYDRPPKPLPPSVRSRRREPLPTVSETLSYDDAQPDLSRQRSTRVGGVIDEHSLHNMIDIKSSLSTIELTLIAITVAVIVLKVAVTELSTQVGSAISGGDARRLLDVSISVGFIAIVLATLQIPRHFTDALIHSNHDTLRILQMVGATPQLVAKCLAKVVLRSMIKAAWKGLVITAILYLVISELAQWWVPVTRTYFLREVAEAFGGIIAFIVVMNFLLRAKVRRFFAGYTRT